MVGKWLAPAGRASDGGWSRTYRPSESLAAAPAPEEATRLALGVGYPDVRARLGLGHGWAVEAKVAFDDGLQVYSGCLGWAFAALGPLAVVAGAEGGWARFDGVDTLSGDGSYAQAYLGLEYPFARRLRVTVDAGPAWLSANAGGHSYSSTDLIYNTALYFYLF